jgi:hypothetical protein
MYTSNKILSLIVVITFLTVVGVGYYNYFIRGDYLVTKQISCDPKIESCFVSDCESNDSSCDSKTTYKKISVESKYAGSNFDNLLSCPTVISSCQIITCQDSEVDAGEKCFK